MFFIGNIFLPGISNKVVIAFSNKLHTFFYQTIKLHISLVALTTRNLRAVFNIEFRNNVMLLLLFFSLGDFSSVLENLLAYKCYKIKSYQILCGIMKGLIYT